MYTYMYVYTYICTLGIYVYTHTRALALKYLSLYSLGKNFRADTEADEIIFWRMLETQENTHWYKVGIILLNTIEKKREYGKKQAKNPPGTKHPCEKYFWSEPL